MEQRENFLIEMQIFLAEKGMKEFLLAVSETVTTYGENVGGIRQWDCDETAERLTEEANRF
jgi:hypothetical protein